MKTKTAIITASILSILITGCALFGANPKGPSKFEQAIFQTVTNVVEREVVVLKTNTVSEVFFHWKTNEVGIIVPHTNEILIQKYELLTVTQKVEQYTMMPSTNTVANVGAAGAIANTFAPGAGTIFGGILLGALSAWAKMRSAKNAAPVLAQNIETIREFIKTLPDGAKYDKALTDWMASNQQEVGSADAILKILNSYVNNAEAKGTVAEIQAALAALK